MLFEVRGDKQQRLADLQIRITTIASPVPEMLTTPCVRKPVGQHADWTNACPTIWPLSRPRR